MPKVLQNLQKFRVRVWMSYRTYRSSGLGYKTLTELTEVPGIVARAYRTHRSSGHVQTRCTGTPGIVKRGVQNLQKFSVGYEGRTELTEVPGTGIKPLQNSQKFSVGYFPGKYPGYGSVGTLQNLTL